LSTKIHAMVDALAIPLAFLLTAGQPTIWKALTALLTSDAGRYLVGG